MHICKEIDNLSDLEEVLEYIPEEDSNVGPCYQHHIVETAVLDTSKCSVGEFMSLFSQEEGPDALFTYSVTTLEDNYKEWVELAMMIPGSTVAVVERNQRTCYFCCVPNTPNLEAL